MVPTLVFLAVLAALWWLTRDLRRAWYPRFAIELLGLALIAIAIGGALSGQRWDRSHANMGEPE